VARSAGRVWWGWRWLLALREKGVTRARPAVLTRCNPGGLIVYMRRKGSPDRPRRSTRFPQCKQATPSKPQTNRAARHPYISSGADTPSKSSDRASTDCVASQSASLNACSSDPTTWQSR
jgi:hypothetical protein